MKRNNKMMRLADMKPLETLEELAVILDGLDNDDPNLELGFDMAFYKPTDETTHPCGSACCIGGWANLLKKDTFNDNSEIEEVLMSISNLEYKTANNLCFNMNAMDRNPTPQQGAQAIRNAIEFGDPKWEELLGMYSGK
jgi:hypothetical protein